MHNPLLPLSLNSTVDQITSSFGSQGVKSTNIFPTNKLSLLVGQATGTSQFNANKQPNVGVNVASGSITTSGIMHAEQNAQHRSITTTPQILSQLCELSIVTHGIGSNSQVLPEASIQSTARETPKRKYQRGAGPLKQIIAKYK